MKIKVSNATNMQLNWLVATIEGKKVWICQPNDPQHVIRADSIHVSYSPTTNPALAWPIIDREHVGIDFDPYAPPDTAWMAQIRRSLDPVGDWVYGHGSTSLIAAMRCYVASKLGDEVEVPEELK